MPVKTVEWICDAPPTPVPGRLRFVDQTRLPAELVFKETRDVREIWEAIRNLRIRGAPAIGVAAAHAVVAAVQSEQAPNGAALSDSVRAACAYLASCRPTAVNLFWALNRMAAAAEASRQLSPDAVKRRLAEEAASIHREDEELCRGIGRFGATLLEDGQAVLTHCNAGGLATSGYGTALAAVYMAVESGKRIRVFADETRPLLQGSRLTAWELMQEGIDVTVICDNTAAQVMREGRIHAVLVGADRIAANGDTANKIGTYGLAVLAQAHGIPFYVLAPTSTFDMKTARGEDIPIEERDASEVTNGFGRRTAPEGVKVYSPAFDVTPARLITAIVCEKGIARPDYAVSLRHFIG